MALYAIGDLHLSLGADKPMDVFGGPSESYAEKIRLGFSALHDDDVCVLSGRSRLGHDHGAGAAGLSQFVEDVAREKDPAQGQPRLLVEHAEKGLQLF